MPDWKTVGVAVELPALRNSIHLMAPWPGVLALPGGRRADDERFLHRRCRRSCGTASRYMKWKEMLSR